MARALADHIAIVTGSASGIGRADCHEAGRIRRPAC